MQTYYIEITDTFGGEANYSWITRHKVAATTERGAMRKIGRESGLSWHKTGDFGDVQRWDSASGATCAFVELWDEPTHGEYSRINSI
jgi:hypothetical protein